MNSKVLIYVVLALVILNLRISLAQYVIGESDADRKLFDERSRFMVGDSCTVLNPERHDGFVHSDGFSIDADSLRFLISFHPHAYPWAYNKVCIGFTRLPSGATTLNYDVVMYDSSASGNPGNLLYFSPVQNASGIPGYPQLAWYSAAINPAPVNNGAVYIGVQFHNQPSLGIYLSVDISAGTALWTGYYATNGTVPPVWQQVLNFPAFANYKCFAIRTEGQQILGIQNSTGIIPQEYFLNQNYPNPFNPSTEFNFGIPRAGNVRIAVYDMLGQLVTVIADEYKTAGIYSAKFDAWALSSGVYFYKLISNDYVETKKMVIIK
jgi:hypothetical protein